MVLFACGSPSTSNVLNSSTAKLAARLIAVVVFPTPPFWFADTKILLTSQAHYEQVGAMAKIKKMTGVELMLDEKDAGVLATGGTADYELGQYGITSNR